MKKNVYRILLCMFIILTCCSCKQQTAQVTNNVGETYKIALLGKESYVYSDIGFINGVTMAVEELAGEVDIVWEHYDDKGEYETGLLYGGQLAEDESVLAVFTFQDFEVIEALAPVYEDAEKPFVSVQGCYESTLQEKYTYFLSAFTSAKDMGIAMGNYCKDNGYSRIVCSHTDTAFERSEMQGFQEKAYEHNISVVDMLQGPDTMTELKKTYIKWKKLDMDAVYLAQYTYSNTEWMLEIIKYLKENDPDLLIMSDYSLNNDEVLSTYGTWLEGVVIPAPYSIEENDLTEEFRRQYEDRYQITMSNVAIQGYDLIHLFAELIKEGKTEGYEMMETIKNENGYKGLTGTMKFAANGKLEGIATQYLIVENGRFVTKE